MLPASWPAAGPPAAGAQSDLAGERTAARRMHPALVLLAAAQVVNLVTMGFVAPDIIDAFRADPPKTASGWQLSQNLAAVPALIALVLLIMWSFRIATIASNLHYPARRSPAWAVGGWFIPIANMWFPYRSIRDSLRPGSTAADVVGRWWVCYIASAYWIVPVFVVGLVSTSAALALALPGIVAALLSVRLGWEVVDTVLADHTEAIEALTPGA